MRIALVLSAIASGQLAGCHDVAEPVERGSPGEALRSVAGAAAVDSFVIHEAAPNRGGAPELPREYLNTDMPALTGRSIRVPEGRDIQDALDAARPGDELVLDAGATYTGTLVLRKKEGAAWITIRTSGSLPAEGTRITPSDAPRLARLVARRPSEQVIRTAAGAHHYRLVGLEITTASDARRANTLVSLGNAGRAQNTMESQPHHLVLDRVYVHGTPTLSFQRCVALNSASTAIIDSWLSECHGKGFDSQAIGGWNGTGPYKIVNNHLEGAGENVMFGGADPAIPGALPRDMEIRRNHFIKPAEWKGVWSAKNLLEFKIGQRILVEGNVFENSWVDAQTGFAINMKSTNQSGSAPWSETSDVTVRYNVIRNTAHGVSIAANPESRAAVPASRILFEQNVFDRIGTGDYRGGRLFQVSGIADLTISHNTATSSHSFMILVGGTFDRLTVTNNVFAGTSYGLTGNGAGGGTAALNTRAPGWTFKGNVIAGARGRDYPAGNSFPATVDVGSLLTVLAAADSPARVANTGRRRAHDTPIRPGADASLVSAAVAGVAVTTEESPAGDPVNVQPSGSVRWPW